MSIVDSYHPQTSIADLEGLPSEIICAIPEVLNPFYISISGCDYRPFSFTATIRQASTISNPIRWPGCHKYSSLFPF
jgi:hypothetical protein